MKNYIVTAVKFAAICLFFSLFLNNCANQQPPGGGDEDKTPPAVRIISPKPNSVEFRGNSVVFGFNEYVDKRSFQDAFRISPKITGETEYNWSGKEVEVKFPQDLYKAYAEKTFVVNISTTLKDIHGNTINEPVSFAFSTGSKIDMGGIAGSVYNSNNKIAAVFAYNIENSIEFDPVNNLPDYLTETSVEGKYKLTNLAPGKYRVITIIDDDKNLLFTSERESYGVLPYDAELRDSAVMQNVNFYMKDISSQAMLQPELDYTKYFKDSLGIVFTSVENDSRIVLPEQSIFIFFNRFKPSRESLVSSLRLTDEYGSGERVVFNWKNDSLVEVFPQGRYSSNRKYELAFDMKTLNDSVYKFSMTFRTVSVNSFGELKGIIFSAYPGYLLSDIPVRIELEAESIIPLLKYSAEVRDTVFTMKSILEADYGLFSYMDINGNSAYNYGYPFPFEHSEPFFIYAKTINIKGGWTVENVKLIFEK